LASVITTQNLKDYLEISGSGRDGKISLVVFGVNSFVTNWTGRDWQQTSRNESYPGLGGRHLILKHYPVKTLTSLTEDGDTIDVSDSDEVELDADRGVIIRTGGVFFRTLERIYDVVYTGGPDGAPDDLKLAALEIAGFMYRASGGVRSRSFDDQSQDLFMSALHDLPTARAILDANTDSARTMIMVTDNS